MIASGSVPSGIGMSKECPGFGQISVGVPLLKGGQGSRMAFPNVTPARASAINIALAGSSKNTLQASYAVRLCDQKYVLLP